MSFSVLNLRFNYDKRLNILRSSTCRESVWTSSRFAIINERYNHESLVLVRPPNRGPRYQRFWTWIFKEIVLHVIAPAISSSGGPVSRGSDGPGWYADQDHHDHDSHCHETRNQGIAIPFRCKWDFIDYGAQVNVHVKEFLRSLRIETNLKDARANRKETHVCWFAPPAA